MVCCQDRIREVHILIFFPMCTDTRTIAASARAGLFQYFDFWHSASFLVSFLAWSDPPETGIHSEAFYNMYCEFYLFLFLLVPLWSHDTSIVSPWFKAHSGLLCVLNFLHVFSCWFGVQSIILGMVHVCKFLVLLNKLLFISLKR